MNFFAYYSEFDFEKYAISIKNNCVFLKENQSAVMFIEEPFNQTNTARCVNQQGSVKIRNAIMESNKTWNSGEPNLSQIGVDLRQITATNVEAAKNCPNKGRSRFSGSRRLRRGR
uniref:PAP-associated domain-containing protein n=1 Tax=Panagrolaimus superbus TaxID=310955 RepID=A0A914YTK5_9BILA